MQPDYFAGDLASHRETKAVSRLLSCLGLHSQFNAIGMLDSSDLRYPGQVLSPIVLKFCCWHVVKLGLALWQDAVCMPCQLVSFSLAQSVLGWRLLFSCSCSSDIQHYPGGSVMPREVSPEFTYMIQC